MENSSTIECPRHFIAKILHIPSKDHKIIHSVRGPNGGFYLNPKARKLSVSIILLAKGEEGVLDKCVMGLKKCSESKPCPMHAQYASIRRQLIKLYKTKTIEQFALEMKDGVVFN